MTLRRPFSGASLAKFPRPPYNPAMTVLIVDDSRIMRKIIKNSLVATKRFAEVEFVDASDGVEALQVLETIPVELLLVDWNMPRLNGLELVKKLRSDIRFLGLPIIMITSEAAKYNVIEAVKAGVNDYLIKPVSEKGLMEKIDRVLSGPS